MPPFLPSRRMCSACCLVFIIVIPFSLKAQRSGKGTHINLTSSAGYSVESFDWSIAGQNSMNEQVDVLSELKWTRLGGINLFLGGEWYVWKDLFIRADLSKTFITSGNVSDTDFGKDNRRDTLFHDLFNSNKGSMICYSVAAGHQIHFFKKHTLALFAGYGNDSQSLYLLRDNGNVQGDLKSTYQTTWNGLFAGLNVRACVNKKLLARGELTYHQVRYSAVADWNLIANFQHPVSFEHQAKGYGLATEAGLEYVIDKKISTLLRIRHHYWTTGRGTDTLYRTNGDTAVTQLNPVHRSGLFFSAGIQVKFN